MGMKIFASVNHSKNISCRPHLNADTILPCIRVLGIRCVINESKTFIFL